MISASVEGSRLLHQAPRMTQYLNALTHAIIGAAIAVHKTLGPGLLESAYEKCFEIELIGRGLLIERQKALAVKYGETTIDAAYRMDFLVNGEVVIEVKSVEKITQVHKAQMLSYLRLADKRIGLLINFNVKWLADQGIHRFVNEFPDRPECSDGP
jgi:GxxExxY protein